MMTTSSFRSTFVALAPLLALPPRTSMLLMTPPGSCRGDPHAFPAASHQGDTLGQPPGCALHCVAGRPPRWRRNGALRQAQQVRKLAEKRDAASRVTYDGHAPGSGRARSPSATVETRDGRMARSGGRGSASWFLTAVFALALAGATGCGSSDFRRRCERGHAGELDGRNRADRRRLDRQARAGARPRHADPVHRPQVPAAVVHREGAKRSRTRSARRTS